MKAIANYQRMTENQQNDYVPQVVLADYSYDLPDDRIAERPADVRDNSRLLLCRAGTGRVEHRRFAELPDLIPDGATFVVNDTKVVRARLLLYKETGGQVEVLLVDPVEPSTDPAVALAAHGETLWHCMVGGLKKIRSGGEIGTDFLLPGCEGRGKLRARLEGEDEVGPRIRFKWSPEALSFADVVEAAGHIPLPPYIRRKDVPADATSYQTVYAEHEGAVAAPTAGLHFTAPLLDKLHQNGANILRLTLHVGAGTFAPVKGNYAAEHPMHAERIAVSSEALEGLEEAAFRREETQKPLIAVGTTSIRTLESLYWFGTKLLRNEIPSGTSELVVNQWDPYRIMHDGGVLPTLGQALESVAEWHRKGNFQGISGVTRLMIVPGYQFTTADALITNFHQPGSTLILLIAAFLEGNLWKEAYRSALEEGYRFLSYGDSSLLIGSNAPF